MRASATTPDPIDILIIDHESTSRLLVRRLIEEASGFRVRGECHSPDEGIEFLRAVRPDVVVLRTELGNRSGFDVLEQVERDAWPLLIFIGRDSGYALRALEVQAAGYVLEPIVARRFRIALVNVRERVRQRRLARLGRRSSGPRDPVAGVRQADSRPRGRPDESDHPPIAVRLPHRIVFLEPSDIQWVAAERDYVRLHTSHGHYLTRETMTRITRQLGGERFVRIHRSTIVRLSFIRELREARGPGRHWVAVLRDGEQRAVSDSGRRLLAATSLRM